MVYLNYKVNIQWRGENHLLSCTVLKYDKAVDNASVELRYNDPSGTTAFTSLLIKKEYSCNSNDFDFSAIMSLIPWLIQGKALHEYNWNNSETEYNYIPFTMKLSEYNVVSEMSF